MSGYCRWWDKDLRDVTEHEQQCCEEDGQDCCDCPDLEIKKDRENVDHGQTLKQENFIREI